MSETFAYSTLLAVLQGLAGSNGTDAMAMRLRLAAGMIRDSEPADTDRLSSDETGRLMALAFRPDTADGDDADPQLSEVLLTVGDRGATITPDAASRHPMLRDWLAASLAGTFATFIERTADLSLSSPLAPVRWVWDLSEAYGCVAASLVLELPGEAYAQATFGPRLPGNSFITVRRIEGAGLSRFVQLALDLNTPAQPGTTMAEAQTVMATYEAESAVKH